MSERRFKGVDLADRLGVRPATISGWRNGEYLPETSKRIELAEIFKVSPTELFTVNERPMLRPLTCPPDDKPPRKIKRKDLEAEVSYYLDRAERAGALQVAALHIRKYLRTEDFKYFDTDSESPTNTDKP